MRCRPRFRKSCRPYFPIRCRRIPLRPNSRTEAGQRRGFPPAAGPGISGPDMRPAVFHIFSFVVILIASAPFLPVFPEQVQDARRGRQQDQPGKGNRNRQLRDPRSRYPVRACRFRRRRFAFCGQAQALGVIQRVLPGAVRGGRRRFRNRILQAVRLYARRWRRCCLFCGFRSGRRRLRGFRRRRRLGSSRRSGSGRCLPACIGLDVRTRCGRHHCGGHIRGVARCEVAGIQIKNHIPPHGAHIHGAPDHTVFTGYLDADVRGCPVIIRAASCNPQGRAGPAGITHALHPERVVTGIIHKA